MIKTILITLLILNLPHLSFAKSPEGANNPKRHLSEYILSTTQIQKLEPSEQLIYFRFLIYITGVSEIMQTQRNYEIHSSIPVKTWDIHSLLKRFALIESAHASPLVLVPIFMGAARIGIPRAIPFLTRSWNTFATAARSSTTYVPQTTAFKMAATSAVATGAAVEIAHTVDGAKGTTTDKNPNTITETSGSPGRAANLNGSAGRGGANATSAGRAGGGGASSKVDSAGSGSEYATPGAVCLFGGHQSVYKTMGDGRVLCTRPKNTVNTKHCMGTAEKPKFYCQSFGLKNSPRPEELASQLCINLHSDRGLEDLTERCVAAAGNWLVKNLPTILSTAEWEEFRKGIKAYLDDYEKARTGSNTSLLAYCAENNQMNNELQKAECKAVTAMVETLNTHTKVERVIAAAAPAPARSAPAPGTARSVPAPGAARSAPPSGAAAPGTSNPANKPAAK